jgi:Cys-tRNA(Pro)/Cys-tRNA(Cys) deacylase
MTPAITALRRARVVFELLEYAHDPTAPSLGLEAASALGLSPSVVFKTLVAELDAGRLVVALVPVDRELDLKALAAALGVRSAAMAPVALAERATGYVAGGISPFGQRRPLPVVADDTLASHARVCVSAGRRGLQVALDPADLLRVTNARLASIARFPPPGHHS